ncbi:AraC family transcriptional regulator [Cypionkella aquatica]|uniref:AraC family transcriptional regulator n=1 Tax=Cypionkella aquatica TaxID=1756042 RepID=A0AA37TQX8_9RHOB|nr:AraC family transcriptional regulator [Cypionkella aquatica]GLS85543.1 AraC family transcriptional regulator [Cypionkella aquatica]
MCDRPDMPQAKPLPNADTISTTDPLAQIVTLLQPRAPFAKLVQAAGDWRVRREASGHVSHWLILTGQVCLCIDNRAPIILRAGDFVLAPASFGYTIANLDLPADTPLRSLPVVQPDGSYRLGDPEGAPSVQMLVGHCLFGAADADLLVSLLPEIVIVPGQDRLAALASLVSDECRANRPAREVILERLLEVLFIEALRATARSTAAPGLVQGLADPRLAPALRAIHADPAHPWTIAKLALTAALSRSPFCARFHRVIGLPPMEYLLNWRMALAKDLLHKDRHSLTEIATRVGYGSASAFSTAFSRHQGQPPKQFAAQGQTA